MAHAWELSPTIVGFNLYYPEEVILIHHFMIAHAAFPNDPILKEFSQKFFSDGKGVSAVDYEHIIRLARNISASCEGLLLRPSGKTEYIATRDKAKAALRTETRHKLDQRNGAALLADAYRDLEKLPPVVGHDQAAQRVLFQRHHNTDGGTTAPLSEEELQRRREALRAEVGSSSPGTGAQPDLTGVDLLQHMGSKEEIPVQQAPVPSNTDGANLSSKDVLLLIHEEIGKMNETLSTLVTEVRRLRDH